MIITSENNTKSNRVHNLRKHDIVIVFIIFDTLIYCLASSLATILVNFSFPKSSIPIDWQFRIVLLSIVSHFLCAWGFKLYEESAILDLKPILFKAIKTIIAAVILVVFWGAALKISYYYSRLWFFIYSTTAIVLMSTARTLSIGYIHYLLTKNAYIMKVISVGFLANPLDAAVIESETNNEAVVIATHKIQDLKDINYLMAIAADEEADVIVINLPWESVPLATTIFNPLKSLAIDIVLMPSNDGFKSYLVKSSLKSGRLRLVIADTPHGAMGGRIKRLMDIILSATAIVIFLPIFIVVSIAVKLSSSGPVLFFQPRIGLNGKIFHLAKFRSMFHDMADYNSEIQTKKNDPRLTTVGKFIRRTSLDELPQLFNVLEGSMSLVGPRPHALSLKAGGLPIEEISQNYSLRNSVKPGITGLAQVSGARGELSDLAKFNKRVQLDQFYIENWSVTLDIKILLKTVYVVFFGADAY